MKLFVFGSSLTSSYWNGAATYYRGIYRNLAEMGFQITFAEPDIYGRQQHRDDEDFSYAEIVVYHPRRDLPGLLDRASEADLVIKHSGIGADDAWVEERVLDCRSATTRVAFWDVDAPATLAGVEANALHPFRALIPEYDYVFTYGGGPPIVEHYERLGARVCHPVYNALDPKTHYPVAPDPARACDLVFVGNRLPDRERRVEEFFLAAADQAPEFTFALGGEGWGDKPLPKNVRWLGHVGTNDHNVVNCSARMVLNLNRESMVRVGYSPPTRVFEAAAAGACVITDEWEGIDTFFEPGCEILVARNAGEIVDLLRTVDNRLAREIGDAMRRRAGIEHTYALRALQVREILRHSAAEVREWRSRELQQPA
ncbi:MAG TPA: glycosyltransferase [Candidatus Binatia bacterium]|nr:glycosyltransferase [Candidatus Binatia bacterium]